jgi:hypothetical protein
VRGYSDRRREMSENRKVEVSGEVYKMYRVASSGWVFVVSEKSGRGYDVAHVSDDGRVLEIEDWPALSDVSNEELAQAWVDARE